MTSHRRLALLAGLGAVALAASTLSASAAYCTAYSRSAYGWGSSPSLAQAKRIALAQCAMRTPRGQWCRIRSCR